MGKKRKQLSHAEIWDDSALLQSWDDALTEYKLYHSIHARGERVEDVIKELAAEEENMYMIEDSLRRAPAGTHTSSISSGKLEDGELEEEPNSAQEKPNEDSTETSCGPSASESQHQQPFKDASTGVDQPEKSGMPSAVCNGDSDETLKSLMMSWYYAGYYSGLYEGQQQAQSHTREQGK